MMSEMKNLPKIPASQFAFVGDEGRLHDKKLETKPVGYFKDAMIRFCKNKSSVVAAYIILFLVLYAIFVPIFCETTYSRALTDTTYLMYTKLPPKVEGMGWLGMDGTGNVTVNEADYNTMRALAQETGLDPVLEVYRAAYTDPTSSSKTTFYDLKVDNYYRMGMAYLTLTPDEFESIQAWQDETGIQVIYPAITDTRQSDANIWYEANRKGVATLDDEGNFQPIYKTTTPTDTIYHSLRIAADNDPERPLAYARVGGTSSAPSYVVRVCKYTYFQYRYGFEPAFVFGTNAKGQDIFTRLAAGARFSFLLAISISAINLFIGAIYGAIEGYYGGAVDLIMERVSDILNGIPFVVVTTLFQLHLSKRVGVVPALLFAFVSTGWIGMASRVRMQFYRFKGQEYVLAARTLGANDRRLMFKHIFPNSLGTIITSCALVIPGVINSESMLSYLGIVKLGSAGSTSLGTLLSDASSIWTNYPHLMIYPALILSLLMICFNLFGNGLRDAFNPSLRGVED